MSDLLENDNEQHPVLLEEENVEQLLKAHRERKRPFYQKVVRFAFRTFMVLLLFLFVLRVIVSFPVVQNRLVNWTTDYLSDRLKTTVKVDYVDVVMFDDLLMDNFLVLDLDGDTIIYSQQLKIELDAFSMFRQKASVKSIYLKNTQINFIQPKNGRHSNVQFILDELFPPGEPAPVKPPKPLPWDLNLKNFSFTNLSFRNDNSYVGILSNYSVKKGQINFDKFDLKASKIAIDQLYLNGIHSDYIVDSNRVAYIPRKVDSIDYSAYPDTFSRKPFLLEAKLVQLRNGDFHFMNRIFDYGFDEEDFDYANMWYQDISADIKDVKFYKNQLNSKLIKLSAKEQKGLIINELSGNLSVNSTQAMLSDMKLITPDSYLGDTLAFQYRKATDFARFNDKVKLYANLNNSEVAISDILMVAPVLKSNPFFRSNKDEKVKISGRIYDRVNRLRGKDLKLQIGRSRLEGEFRSNRITMVNEATLNLRLKRLNTNMRNIQLLVNQVKIPEQMMRLGNIDFSGSMDGFLLDFVAKGKLRSDLGSAESNIKFNFKPGRGYGSYDGFFGLKKFDLGKWLDNSEFGMITFRTDVDGQGYSIDEIKASLEGKVNEFNYKNYTYKDIEIDGKVEPNLFDGKLIVADRNIDLSFAGTVDFTNPLPKFALQTTFNRVNLKPLNLFDYDYILSGSLQTNFIGDNPNNIDGYAALRNFRLEEDTVVYKLDSIRVVSDINDLNARFYEVKSDMLKGRILSNFDFIKVQNVLLNYVSQQFPEFTDALNLKKAVTGDSLYVYQPENPENNEFYTLFVEIYETRNWLDLLKMDIDEIKNLTVRSRFDSKFKAPRKTEEKPRLIFDMQFPLFRFGDLKIGKSFVRLRANGNHANIYSTIRETQIGDSLSIPNIKVNNSLEGDSIKFEVGGAQIGEVFKKLQFDGALRVIGDVYQIRIDNSNVLIYNKQWSIAPNNKTTIYDNRIVPVNVVLSNATNDETIRLDSLGRKGLLLDVKNIKLEWLEEFVDLGGYVFKGKVNGLVKIEDLFNASNFNAQLKIDSLQMNQDVLGDLEAEIGFPNLNAPIAINSVIKGRDNSKFGLRGTYSLPTLKQNTTKDHYFNFKAEVRNYPLNIIENFVGDFISNTEGYFDGDIIIAGTPTKPEMSGNIRLNKAGILIDYLQTFYRIDRATIKVANDAFTIQGKTVTDINNVKSEGAIIKDRDNNQAFVQGKVRHNNLKDFNFDILMSTSKFILLDTKKSDNELFYGTAIGSSTLRLTGPLSQPNININATALSGTNIVLPISYESSASEVKFIKFRNEENEKKAGRLNNYVAPQGLNVEMNLDINPSAEIRLVFDEQAGDEIRGRGNGNLQIGVTRTGDFTMSGTYIIERGEYLFTFKNFINKPFEVRRGGSIVWTGDPFDATINLSAYYRNLNVAPYNFIVEYLATDDETIAAQKSTNVDLKMVLKGELFKPDITFDLEFPNADNLLVSYIESKLKLVREDENELNRQIFALIVLRDFLPSNAAVGIAQGVIGSGFNTLTEMLSNQFSIYVSDLLSEIIGTNGVISSIDVDVNYRRAEFQDLSDLNEPVTIRGNEVTVGMRNGLFNDRLIISGNVNFDDAYGQYTSDFEVEWMITPDGRWRMRAYNRGEVVVSDYRNKAGVGISYRREFDNLKELFKNIVKDSKEKPVQ